MKSKSTLTVDEWVKFYLDNPEYLKTFIQDANELIEQQQVTLNKLALYLEGQSPLSSIEEILAELRTGIIDEGSIPRKSNYRFVPSGTPSPNEPIDLDRKSHSELKNEY